jgi:voltage-gated potassium channel
MGQSSHTEETEKLAGERARLLETLEQHLERPMIALAFVWLALLILELAMGERGWTVVLSIIIWIIFILDFAVRLALAPSKLTFLKRNWLTALSLVVPALRGLRLFALGRFVQIGRVSRGARLVRVVSSVNRGMSALSSTMRRRGFGYVILLTIIVVLAGAAGMLAFEKQVPIKPGIHTYGEAVWWTAMIITTMGTDYWPQTGEGRLLCFLLALYAFAVFGYVTATIATFFIGRDAEELKGKTAVENSVNALRAEITALRDQLQRKE